MAFCFLCLSAYSLVNCFVPAVKQINSSLLQNAAAENVEPRGGKCRYFAAENYGPFRPRQSNDAGVSPQLIETSFKTDGADPIDFIDSKVLTDVYYVSSLLFACLTLFSSLPMALRYTVRVIVRKKQGWSNRRRRPLEWGLGRGHQKISDILALKSSVFGAL